MLRERGAYVLGGPDEVAEVLEELSSALGEAHRKWPTGIYLLWYPIKERDAPEALARRLRRLGVPRLLRSEMTLRAPRADAGLAGSGLIVVNPPHTLERDLETLLPVLIRVLSPSATQRLDRLVGEQQRSPRGQVAKR